MPPLAKASLAGRYKISYGRRLTKSAILTTFNPDLRTKVTTDGDRRPAQLRLYIKMGKSKLASQPSEL
jgi:hypothetical protein